MAALSSDQRWAAAAPVEGQDLGAVLRSHRFLGFVDSSRHSSSSFSTIVPLYSQVCRHKSGDITLQVAQNRGSLDHLACLHLRTLGELWSGAQSGPWCCSQGLSLHCRWSRHSSSRPCAWWWTWRRADARRGDTSPEYM